MDGLNVYKRFKYTTFEYLIKNVKKSKINIGTFKSGMVANNYGVLLNQVP